MLFGKCRLERDHSQFLLLDALLRRWRRLLLPNNFSLQQTNHIRFLQFRLRLQGLQSQLQHFLILLIFIVLLNQHRLIRHNLLPAHHPLLTLFPHLHRQLQLALQRVPVLLVSLSFPRVLNAAGGLQPRPVQRKVPLGIARIDHIDRGRRRFHPFSLVLPRREGMFARLMLALLEDAGRGTPGGFPRHCAVPTRCGSEGF
uniref:(northern house mosquito) hypothetical protein n=1 Tax=Culex pipiens TaxID=7175 RepID=A0A8D8IUV7_CULPI